jgi:hypothetical protein
MESEAAGGRLAVVLSWTDLRSGASWARSPARRIQERTTAAARFLVARKHRRMLEYIGAAFVENLRDRGVSKMFAS